MAFSLDADQAAVRSRVDFYVVKLPVFDPQLGTSLRDTALDIRLEELTTYFTVFSFNTPRNQILLAPSVDDALAAGDKDFCLIQNAGHIFYGHGGLAADLLKVLDQCQFLTGRVVDRGGYFYLHDQCFLVNRHAWKAAGRPAFGVPHVGTRSVAVPVFTPTDLNPSGRGELAINGRFGYGWNAISASLTAEYTVRQWPVFMNKWMVDCGAYRSDLGTWRESLLENVVAPRPTAPPPLRDYLHFLSVTLGNDETSKPIFVFNSEADADIPVMGINPGLDTAFMLAAGFKSNRILERIGFTENTEVVYYDYNAPTLALKRMTLEEWDGVDFGAFFMAVRPRLEAMFPEKLAYLQSDALNTAGTINKEFQDELRGTFESFDHWMTHWWRFKALKHSYVQLDLLRQPDEIRAMIGRHAKGHSVMWISDAFNAPYAVAKFSWRHRHNAYSDFADSLAERTDSSLLLGGAPALWLAG
ncbi:MAG: hypothetical protein EPO08_01210 [Rhodospirillaceae bacterium]|nr:MAG: hypothetical protein EPO08_01210 [Rhodospirillaceae bacterium]